MNGIYAAYFSGAIGNSFALLIFKDGQVSGADAGFGRYDGQYSVLGNRAEGQIIFHLPPNSSAITGVSTGDQPLDLSMAISLSLPIEDVEYHEIQTPFGPVNARFEKIREY